MNAASPPDVSHTRIAQRLGALAPGDGPTPSRLDGVTFARASESTVALVPMMYEPGICLALQGRKRVHFAGRTFVYDAGQLLVVSAPLSVECETLATPDAPVLAMFLRTDLTMLAELLLALDDSQGDAWAEPTGIVASPLTEPLADAIGRLLDALVSPVDARILGPAIVREIFYRVLTGEQGDSLRAALSHRGEFGQISRALRRIQRDCAAPLDVATLAREAHMSVASFHHKFKALTSTSPMQYLKATRLHRARQLMLQQGVGAAAAALSVGYESPSQFSREFKRLFQRTPTEEIAQMRGAGTAL